MRWTPLLALLAFGLAACDLGSDAETYDLSLFTGFDQFAGSGEITLDGPVRLGAVVFGTYRLDQSNLAPSPSGRLRAECAIGVNGNPLFVRLDVEDAGLLLVGDCDDVSAGGDWSYLSVTGEEPGGFYRLDQAP